MPSGYEETVILAWFFSSAFISSTGEYLLKSGLHSGKSRISLRFLVPSVYPDLRIESAKLMSEASYLPIGGVVPLLESYLNTTLTNPAYYQLEGQLMSHINISMKNINARYVYITTTGGNNDQYVQITGTHTPINCKQEGNKWINKYSSFDNLHSMGINFVIPNFYLHNGNYNFTLTVSAGKLHNTFNIHTEKESAIYGYMSYNDSPEPDKNINCTLFTFDSNNSRYYNVNIKDGYYYFFVNDNSNYSFYYLNNSTLKPLEIYTDYRDKGYNYITTGNNTGSIEGNFVHPLG